jgi:hypothetical protein
MSVVVPSSLTVLLPSANTPSRVGGLQLYEGRKDYMKEGRKEGRTI